MDELNTIKLSLEDDLKVLATANNASSSDGMSNEQQEKFDKMDETFWDRSDKWQESDNGQDFEDKMNAVDNAIDELNSTIEDLETEFNIN